MRALRRHRRGAEGRRAGRCRQRGPVRLGGPGQVHALLAACHRGELRRGHGAHLHVPSGHDQDADPGLGRAARRPGDLQGDVARRRRAAVHARLHGHRHGLRAGAHRPLRHLRVRQGLAPGQRGRGSSATGGSGLRGHGHRGARRHHHAHGRGEAASADGVLRRHHGLRALHAPSGGRPRVLPQPPDDPGHEHPLHGALRGVERVPEALPGPRRPRRRLQVLRGPLVLPRCGH
mmetsp:Transcript_82604/g.219270  ORF Transcript_82604/g.219270 Transcript_82604/m.219270 type:complete len:233 (+) Transcript_82604:93-791(+)